jgi:voltage-gated potassium channel
MTDRPRRDGSSLLQRALLAEPLTLRRAGQVIAATSLLLTLAGGVLVWLFDRKGIGSLGDGMWWAMQTVTTVGYGDVVPHGTVGRLIGAVLMLNGIALITVITAIVTATLVEQARKRRGGGPESEIAAALERIEARLDEIDSRIGPARGQP